MTLQDLVPPMDICKLIPDGEFADSCFVWSFSCDRRIKEPFVDYREDVAFCRKNMVNVPDTCPAPTLQEIVEKIDKITCSVTTVSKLPFSCWQIDTLDKEDNLIVRRNSKSPVSVALRLCLELMEVGE